MASRALTYPRRPRMELADGVTDDGEAGVGGGVGGVDAAGVVAAAAGYGDVDGGSAAAAAGGDGGDGAEFAPAGCAWEAADGRGEIQPRLFAGSPLVAVGL